MLVTGHPQFETQDDVGIGDGIPPIPEWQIEPTHNHVWLSELGGNDIDHAVKNVFLRLRNVFQRAQRIPLQPTRLHDLACFVIHRLLFSVRDMNDDESCSSITECLRLAMILYMFIIQGPTYFSHAVMMNTIATQFVEQLKRLESIPRSSDSLDVWLFSIGVVASVGTANLQWLMDGARKTVASMELSDWDDVLVHMKWILWLDLPRGEDIFRTHWEVIFGTANRPGSPDTELWIPPSYHNSVLL